LFLDAVQRAAPLLCHPSQWVTSLAVTFIATTNMMVVVHMIGSYQIHAMPVFDMMETV